MLIYAIHSGNSRLIRMIEDELAAGQEEEENYKDFFVESIKCHHNEIADYMCYKIDENERLSLSLEFHNFYSFSAEEISNILMEKLFYIACKYVNINMREAFENGRDNQDVLQFSLNNEIIGIEMFTSCKKVQQITIPSSITSTRSNAFKECYSLKEIIIPSSIQNEEMS
ncbi:hypothetical protein M9Y10_026671 [Tritrichomonas musculus]|uniref:Leucine-rich repeat domain-containing protein n=1 Tax=Tritrichomonas musculus TaxID=1915356 RepID=A0ABR2H711_9EUKA